MPRKLPLTAAAALALTATLSTVTATTTTAHATPPTPSRIHTIHAVHDLPDPHAYPEGIARDPRTNDLYIGSYATGAVYRATPGHRSAHVFLPAGTDGRRTANGLKVDRAGRLWVTDSTSGVSVYDLRRRTLLARFDVTGDTPSFVNDITLAPDGTAYLTDSRRAVVYRVTPTDLTRTTTTNKHSPLLPAYDLSDVLTPHAPDAYTLNGIVADPTGRYLLTVDSTAGDLYRLDLTSGDIHRVTLHGGSMLLADGLELRHNTLWAAHNTRNAVTRWHLSPNGHTAHLTHEVSDPALQVPTTLLHQNGHTLIVRSQFDKGGPLGSGTPETPFTIAEVDGI